MSNNEIVAVLGYCDERGTLGMTLHEQRDDCPNWSRQARVEFVDGRPAVVFDDRPTIWYEN